MPATVIDASALAAVAFDEPAAEEVASRLDRSDRVVAPALLWFELANTCWKKINRHPEQREWFLERFEHAAELPIEVLDVSHQAVIALACDTGLTAYDANYLWLARHLDADLVTLDKQLAAAAWKE